MDDTIDTIDKELYTTSTNSTVMAEMEGHLEFSVESSYTNEEGLLIHLQAQ